jgi:hypothetical protein
MAIVENLTPDTISSVYRPIQWTFTEANSSVEKLQVEHRINGQIQATTYHLPRLGGYSVYDVDGANIASNFVTVDSADAYKGTVYTIDSAIEYDLLLKGLDENGATVSTLTSSLTYAQNIPVQHDGNQGLGNSRLVSSSSKLLTRRAAVSTIYRGEFLPTSGLVDNADGVYFKLEKFWNGSFVGDVSGSFDPSYTSEKRFLQYIDTNNSYYNNANRIDYQIFFDAGFTIPISLKYTFNIKESCEDDKEVHFMNSLGAMESFTFTGDSIETTATKKQLFKGTISKGWNMKDRGQSVLGVKSVQTIELYSKFLNTAESQMLSDLVDSPLVYIVENNNFIPVIVKDGSFATKTTNGLIQHKVVLQYSNNKIIGNV